MKELDKIINNNMAYFDIKDYYIKEVHDITLCLNEEYYEPFANWLNVGWALHNTHDSLFWTWIKFSAKSSKFNWNDISDLLSKSLEDIQKLDVSPSGLEALWKEAGLGKATFGSGNMGKIYTALEKNFQKISRSAKDKEAREKAETLTKKFGSAEIPDDQETAEPNLDKSGSTLTETDFSLRPSERKPFARKFGRQPVVIQFSDEDLNVILEKAVQELNADIVDMFNTLELYTTKLQEYLTSVAENRDQAAKIAQSTAKELPKKTDAVVLAAGVNDD